MLELIDIPNDRVVGLRIDGKIDNESFDAVLTEIEARLVHHDKVRIYAEIHSLGGMALEALFKDIKFGLGNWRRFDREAIVTDRRWLHRVAPMAGKLFPGIDVKVFALDDVLTARAWVQE
jgi:hypothetical protein